MPGSQLTTGSLVTTDNWNSVERRKPTAATVATSQTTTSTTYTDLTTVGPTVTVTTGTSALVIVTVAMSNSGTNKTLMSFGVTGATTNGAVDARAVTIDSATGGYGGRFSVTYLITGLTAGSNTFTAKYRVTAGTGTFADRDICVIPQD